MSKLKKYINYAIINDCSKCKYGQDGHYNLGLYFCKCKKKIKKIVNHQCNKFKEVLENE